MKKRPISVTIVSWVYIIAGFGGIAAHATEFDLRHPFSNDVVLALIVRVLASWLPISPYSIWIRWSYPLTNWILNPLRRIIPPLGMMDITPIVAYLLLAWVLEPLLVRGVASVVGV